MVRLGLRLTLRSGREAVVRALLVAVAVAIGVTVLLAVFATYHAYEVTSGRPCWECTVAAPSPNVAPSRSELWNYSENIYQGRFIEELDVAALGPGAPVVPGLSHLPGPGELYASPALSKLLSTVPRDELGDRFAGRQVGTIGYRALSGPTELVAVVGYPPARLAALPGTVVVDHIAAQPDNQGTTGIYRVLFWIGAIVVLFPLLVLVNTATRLAAARREERFAAMRLVGATPRQVSAIATVEAVVSAFAGAALGSVLFQAVQPVLAGTSFSGARFFGRYVTPTAPGYLVLLVGVPVCAAAAALWSLHRVRISPLGVSRKVAAPAPGPWRLIPVVVGIALFVLPFALGSRSLVSGGTGPLQLVVLGTVLIMAGLVASGSWLTVQAARLLRRSGRGAPSLLASRRLADNPKAAFRTVSGLVLAVFVGSLVACVVPAFKSADSSLGGGAAALADVLRVPLRDGPAGGPSSQYATGLLAELRSYPGVTVLPLYANPRFSPQVAVPPTGRLPRGTGLPGMSRRTRAVPGNGRSPGGQAGRAVRGQGGPAQQYDSVVRCAVLGRLPALGRCRPGEEYAYVDAGSLMTDNPLFIGVPLVTDSNPAYRGTTQGLPLWALLVRTSGQGTLEKVRTLLTAPSAAAPVPPGGWGQVGPGHDGTSLSAWQMGDLEPETFGEVAAIRNNDLTNAEDVILGIVGLTLFGAACSLVVTVAGSTVERKRPFTLLRLSGTSFSTLCRVVLLEALLPLVGAAVVAGATGIGVALPLVKALPKLQHLKGLAWPGLAYYLALGGGLLLALVVVATALPLLGRVTRPDNARFE